MNEVITLADDKIYYQDTDSLHIFQEDIKVLAEDYKQKYNRELIGENMGQFHSDFTSPKFPKGDNIYSRRFISLGKKCYIDELTSEEHPDIVDYHIRMKGVPLKSIESYCKEQNISPIELYEKLWDGQEVTFDLCKGINNSDNVQTYTRLKKRNNFEYFNITDMKRTLKFK